MAPWEKKLVLDREPTTRDSFLESHLLNRTSFHTKDIFANREAHYAEEDWEPIVTLLARLAKIQQFYFVMENEFPAPLTEALSMDHPNCQVNIWGRQWIAYSAPTLEAKVRESRSTWHNYKVDFNLLRLPGLHALAVTLIYGDDRVPRPHDLDEMLAFLFTAPKLKHLIIPHEAKHWESEFPFAILKKEWQALAATAAPQSLSMLDSISIRRYPPGGFLPKLANIANLSRLRSLQLEGFYDPADLIEPAALFPNLERLFIEPIPLLLPLTDSPDDEGDSIAAIRAFAPLKYLQISSLRNVSSLERILERHGASLRGLILEPSTKGPYMRGESDTGYRYPELDASDIRHMVQTCPNLEELRVPIRRSRGSRKECEMYTALSEFPNLHSLVLDLHYDSRQIPVRRAAETEESVLQEAFVNAAMDKKLALGIWDLMSSSSTKNRYRLRDLRVTSFGHEFFVGGEQYLLGCLSRSFLVTREYNPHNPGSPIVTEIGKQSQEMWRQRKFPEKEEFYVSNRLENILHSIWPSGPGRDGWMSGWTSCPLEVDG
jgi:hypothetical protein